MAGLDPTLKTTDPRTFVRAVELLKSFNSTAPRLLGPNFGVAIALLLHRVVPDRPHETARILNRPDSGGPLTTGQLQVDICDPTWAKAKAFCPPNAEGPIYKPFTESFKPRSPRVNNWRNCFDLQGGLGCDAPYTARYLRSAVYLAEPRFDCRFRDRATGRCNSPAGNTAASRSCFNPNKRGTPPGPDTRAQHRPKLLTRGQGGEGVFGYWYVEPTEDVLADLLANPMKRVPLYPFATALYGGSPYLEARGTGASRDRLENDLAIGHAEFLTLFDPDSTSPLNAEILRLARPAPARGRTSHGRGFSTASAGTGAVDLADPVPYAERSSKELIERAGKEVDPARRRRLLERANQGHRRTLDALAKELGNAGYTVDEQLNGYDLRAFRSKRTSYLFEVKTWTAANLASQVRAGWAQLLEYRYRNKKRLPADIRLYLVLDREPPVEYWAWPWLAEELNVVPCWIASGAIVTLTKYRDRLP